MSKPTRLHHCARQAMLLEARIAGGAYDHPPPWANRAPPEITPTPSPPDKDQRQRPQTPSVRLEDDLAGDANRSIPEILAGICKELNLVVDLGQAHDLPRTIFPDTERTGVLATQSHKVRPKPKPK